MSVRVILLGLSPEPVRAVEKAGYVETVPSLGVNRVFFPENLPKMGS